MNAFRITCCLNSLSSKPLQLPYVHTWLAAQRAGLGFLLGVGFRVIVSPPALVLKLQVPRSAVT